MRNISDIAANISAAKNPVVDAWSLGMMAVELGTAATHDDPAAQLELGGKMAQSRPAL